MWILDPAARTVETFENVRGTMLDVAIRIKKV
jgi:hypothetical protein